MVLLHGVASVSSAPHGDHYGTSSAANTTDDEQHKENQAPPVQKKKPAKEYVFVNSKCGFELTFFTDQNWLMGYWLQSTSIRSLFIPSPGATQIHGRMPRFLIVEDY